MSAADKARLDAIQDPATSTVYVFNEGDFPAPVGNVITLVPLTSYVIMSTVTITGGVRLYVASEVYIIGQFPAVSKIIGNVDAPLIEIGPGGFTPSSMRGVRIENANTGASARAIKTNSAALTLTIDSCLLTCAGGSLDVASCGSMKVIGSTLTAALNGSSAVRFTSCTAAVFEYCQTSVSGAGTRCFSFASGSTLGNISVIRHGLVFSDGSQKGLEDEGAIISGLIVLERILRFPAIGTVNVGWTQKTLQYRVKSVDTLSASMVIGSSYVSAPGFTVPITTMGVPVPVAPAAGTPWSIDTDSERVTLFSTSTGEIEITATEPRTFLILGSVVVSKSGTTQNANLRVYVNGVEHVGSAGEGAISTKPATIACAPSIHTLTAGDKVRLMLSNEEGTDDPTVHSASITVNTGMIS